MKRERLPKGSLDVIKVLHEEGNLTQKELIDRLNHIKPRAVRYTIRQLVERAILAPMANFDDMRSSLIGINPDVPVNLNKLLEKDKSKKSTLII